MTDDLRVSANLAAASQVLAQSGSDSALAEARQLMAHVLSRPLNQLIMVDSIDAQQYERFNELVHRRSLGEPLQHLTGRAYFRHTVVSVGPGVFIPRPETEVMTGWAIDTLNAMDTTNPIVVEFCAGSGVISKALSSEAPQAHICAIELAEPAFDFARRNLSGTDVDLRLGDLDGSFAEFDGEVDLVIANPPYIPLTEWESVPKQVRDYDPEPALFSGADGLDAIKAVATNAARLCRPGGYVTVEHADVQGDAVVQVFTESGQWAEVVDHRDLTDRPRFVTAVRLAS